MTSTALTTLGHKLATRLGVDAGGEMLQTLKQTAFRSAKEEVTDAQLTALLVIANEYGLNPWTREIYAYPDERRGIVPVIGVDGWIRIVNEHAQFDGMEFASADDNAWVTCTIYRKDRTRPVSVTEYLAECKRGTEPWNKWPRRMLRHKALIQCARVAFGFALYDDDEGREATGLVIDNETGEITGSRTPAPPPARPALPVYSDADFEAKFPAWATLVTGEDGKTAQALLTKLSTRATFTETQRARILSIRPHKPAPDAGAAAAATPAPNPPTDPATAAWVSSMNAAEAGAK